MLRILQCTGFARFALQPGSACLPLRHVDEVRAMTSSAVQHQSEEKLRAAKRPRANSTSSDSSVTLIASTDSASSLNKDQLLVQAKSPMTVAIAEPKLLVQLDPEHPNAQAPTRGSALAAGYDLYASQSVTIPKGGRKVVPTGIRIAIPAHTYGRVAPRSGLASKHGIDVGAGVIDADYRGLVGVLLYNFGESDFEINTGDRIAQLVLERIMTPDVETVETLEETVRGAGGFGSTGGFGQKA